MDRIRKIKVALVDSGINKDDISTDTNVIDINLFGFADCSDKTSHGTTCAKIITRQVQKIELFNVKVCNNTTTTPNRLITAIKWCADHKVDIINVSIGCNDVALYYAFDEACRYAHNNGCIIVSSASNLKNICYPAYNHNVIGVGALIDNVDIYVYKRDSHIKFYCNGYNLGKGYTSFAAANMSAYILNLIYSGHKIASYNVQAYLPQYCKRYEFGDPVIECAEFPYSTEYITSDFSLSYRKVSQKYSFLGYKSEIELLSKYKSECIMDLEDLWSIELDENPQSQNVIYNMILPAGINTNHPIVVSDIPSHLSCKLGKTVGMGYIGLKKLLAPLHEFSFDINKEIVDNNILFNQNIDKKLFINLSCQTNVDMLIELFRSNHNQKKTTVVLGDDPLMLFFGFRYIEKQMSANLTGNYIAASVDSLSRGKAETMLMSIDLKEQQMLQYQYDIKAREDILCFTSQLLAYNPDSIFMVVDQYTNMEFIARAIKLVEVIANRSVNIVLKDAFMISSPFYYLMGAIYPRELGNKFFDIQYSRLKSIGRRLDTYNTTDNINEFSRYVYDI